MLEAIDSNLRGLRSCGMVGGFQGWLDLYSHLIYCPRWDTISEQVEHSTVTENLKIPKKMLLFLNMQSQARASGTTATVSLSFPELGLQNQCKQKDELHDMFVTCGMES